MEMKKVFTAFLALSVGLVSCNKSDDLLSQEDGKTRTVTLTVDSNVLTRALAQEVEDGRAVTFEDGYIYFVNVTGQITDYFMISATGDTQPLTNGQNVAIADIKNSNEIQFTVSETAKAIHVFGNIGTTVNALPAANGNISTVMDIVTTLRSQSDTDGRVENVHLYGSGSITEVIGLLEPEYTSYVEISPITSRIELAKVSAKNNAGGGTITAYTLDGIFLNYFYGESDLIGSVNINDFVAYTSRDDFSQYGTPWYNLAYKGLTYDWEANGRIATTTSLSSVPNQNLTNPASNANVWGYNVFESEGVDYLPHLIVKFTGVTGTTSAGVALDAAQDYYVTVKRYHVNGVRVEKFDRGYVYHIEDLEFTADNLKDVGEWSDDDITVGVTMKVLDWKQQVLDTPELD
ncbi:MAG: hypothetical protein LUG51_09265 [Tannerellaceae bacterium]|nr:hypothetical protein [Tannerellaceae bacterium]